MYHGILNIYKEKGYTSHDVVAKLRGILRQKKIGHTGTLDPEAVGVLPVCLGHGTKLCNLLTDTNKAYCTTMQLGIVTDTQDTTGTILEQKEVTCSEIEIQQVIESFVGDYLQQPPMYSAKKINGKKLYELAREGKEVFREPVLLKVDQIQIEKIDIEKKQVTMTVYCSKGTYIRTLCHDIGQSLACGAAMSELCRIKAGNFLIEQSLTLEQIEELVQNNALEDKIFPLDAMFMDYPKITVTQAYEKLLYNGNPLPFTISDTSRSSKVRIYDKNEIFIGIYEAIYERKEWKPIRMFLGES